MLIVIKHTCEEFVLHVLHKLGDGLVVLPIETKSDAAAKKSFKSLFIWWVSEAPPCRRCVKNLRQHNRLKDDRQNVITHSMATQDFYRVERLGTSANDACDMFADGEVICDGYSKYSDRCNTLDTRQVWWVPWVTILALTFAAEDNFHGLSSV